MSKASEDSSPDKQLKQIKTEIYYEKLGEIISQLAAWRVGKDSFITEYYIDGYLQNLKQTRQNQAIVESECLGLLETLHDMKETLSKFNTQNHKEKVVYSQIKKEVKQHAVLDIRSKWNQKKENLRKLSNFIFTFYSIVNNELVEIRKDLGSLEHLDKKLRGLKPAYDTQYASKFEISTSKKKKKYFELGKIQEAIQLFNEENASYDIYLNQAHEMSESCLAMSSKFFQHIASNISHFSKFYRDCFEDQIGQIMSDNAQHLAESFTAQREQFSHSLAELRAKKAKEEQALKDNLELILWDTLDDISVASWDVEVKLEDSNDFKARKAVLTIDQKLIIVDGNRERLQIEFYLMDCQVGEAKQESGLSIKSKKKQKILVRFESDAREDEFRLHLKNAQGSLFD